MVVGLKFQRERSILCDTILGTTLCEFTSTHEEIDVTSRHATADFADRKLAV